MQRYMCGQNVSFCAACNLSHVRPTLAHISSSSLILSHATKDAAEGRRRQAFKCGIYGLSKELCTCFRLICRYRCSCNCNLLSHHQLLVLQIATCFWLVVAFHFENARILRAVTNRRKSINN